ncbi:MAG: hypothetical protein EB078_06440, partial [Proteobacteria bacterium]|nr:hypothetical protein [Pseudomonadota bacterium]
MRQFIFIIGLTSFLFNQAANAKDRYTVIVEKMQAIQKEHASTTALYSIGKNDDGVDIYAMRVSTHPSKMDKNKIGHLIVGTHHGNEGAAADLSLDFLNSLIQRFDSSELYRGQLSDTEWTIVPVLNISGYNENHRHEHGMDPNRDYPGPCISAAGGKLASVKAAMELLASRPFTGSATLHGFVGTFTYPWGIAVKNDHTLDHNRFVEITSKAAEINGYRYGTSTEIVYPCDGSFEDYAYWKHGAWSLLVELRNGSSQDIKS